jgi:hypothetical protein
VPKLSFGFHTWNGSITKSGLGRLRGQLAKPERVLDLTIGGSAEESIHVDLDSQKRAALRAGEKTLARASGTVQRDHRLAALRGLTKQQLHKAVQEREHRPKVQSRVRRKSVSRTR